jgi:hypothetical protein
MSEPSGKLIKMEDTKSKEIAAIPDLKILWESLDCFSLIVLHPPSFNHLSNIFINNTERWMIMSTVAQFLELIENFRHKSRSSHIGGSIHFD